MKLYNSREKYIPAERALVSTDNSQAEKSQPSEGKPATQPDTQTDNSNPVKTTGGKP